MRNLNGKRVLAGGVPIGVPKTLATDAEVMEKLRQQEEQIKFLAEAVGYANANVQAVANAHLGLVAYLQEQGILPKDGEAGETVQ